MPSGRSARLNDPAATWVIPVSPATWTGSLRLVVVPSPSWPCPLDPQAQTVPSDRTARAWTSPAATCVRSLLVRTSPYCHRLIVVPSPSSKFSLRAPARHDMVLGQRRGDPGLGRHR